MAAHCCRGVSLKSFLADYTEYPAIGVNWIMFGSNGRQKRPAKPGVLRWYSQCDVRPSWHIKVITNSRRVAHIGGHPHNFFYKYALFTCTLSYLWSASATVMILLKG
jgi:hypothetical protein